MADFRKGDPVRVAYDAVYYAEPSHRSDEYALVVLPGTVLDGNVLILNRFRAPSAALTKVDEAATVSRDCIVYDGLAVPSCKLVPSGRWMTPDELRDRLEELGKRDPEAGHAFMDDLALSALAAIRDGHDEPHKLAHAVLRAATADFPRWMA